MIDPHDRLSADADQLAASRRRVPGSTYRLQMHAGFTLADARRITPYLHSLGITHAYTSSLLAAKPGSTHGYDVIDHSRLNPEIGTEEEFTAWIDELRARGMGLILDVVPNHMSVGGPNDWWADVLEHGPASPFANYFDIAWNDHPRDRLHGKVLLPILGQSYGAEIEGGRIRIEFADGRFAVHCGDVRLPADPRTYANLLGPALDTLRETAGPDDPAANELQSVLNAVRNLPPRDDANRANEGWAEGRVIHRRLGELNRTHEAIRPAIERMLSSINGVPGDPTSFSRLEEFLDAQAYRPCFWRVASDEINYRRFFDVNDLAAISTETEAVFAAAHKKVFEWIAAGQLDGLRIDHPDGLYDPRQYLDRLQQYTRLAAAKHLLETRSEDDGAFTWADAEPQLRERFNADPKRPLYVAVEKILGDNEALPGEWATDGTTGYEFINLVNGLFVDSANEHKFSDLFHEFTGFDEKFDELVYRGKFQLLQSSLASELHVLAHQLDRLAQAERWSRDFTLNGLRHALREVISLFPVYRTYVNGEVAERDRIVILRAITRARRRSPLLGRAVFDFIRDTLLLKDPPSGPATPEYRAAQRRFAGKFQQVTAPAMAKGFEDTALYVFNRLISLNEVGGEPLKFGRKPEELHHNFRERASRHPGGMSPLSTHDTKRSEDVRARINVLSELPDEWSAAVRRWRDLNRPHRIEIGDGESAPDANAEYLLYQTLIGVWPIEALTAETRPAFVQRIQAYMNKALHEAKVNTTWINPNPEYDSAISEFVARVLDPDRAGEFLNDFEVFHRPIGQVGYFNSLAQTLLRCTAPGVPDTYQGTESWDFSLVDPDNRRPVDYATRARLLAEMDGRAERDPSGLSRELAGSPQDGRIKLFVAARALRLRREHPAAFTGEYIALETIGRNAGHAFCFVRASSDGNILVVVPRLIAGLPNGRSGPPIGLGTWGDLAVRLPANLAAARWTDCFTGESHVARDFVLSIARLLGDFPVGLFSTGHTA